MTVSRGGSSVFINFCAKPRGLLPDWAKKRRFHALTLWGAGPIEG